MNRLKIFTDQDKEKLLLKSDYDMVEGWCMDFERPEDVNNAVIGIHEITKRIKEGCKKYFICEYGEEFEDLETAWDNYVDGMFNHLDTESDDEVFQHLNKLLGNNKKVLK